MRALRSTVAALLALLVLAAPAPAAFPGRNGEISFVSDTTFAPFSAGYLSRVRPDGSGLNATVLPGFLYDPQWSADGSALVASVRYARQSTPDPCGLGGYHSWDEVAIVDPAQGAVRQLTDDYARTGISSLDPSWSPDGRRIAFTRVGCDGRRRAFVMNADGSGARPFPGVPENAGTPVFSPDGRRVAYAVPDGLRVAGADGSGARRVAAGGAEPAWSPDGVELAYTVGRFRAADVWVVHADGTQARRLSAGGRDSAPAWSPDASRIVVSRRGDAEAARRGSGSASSTLWLLDPGGGRARRLTRPDESLDAITPDWRPVPNQRPVCARVRPSRTLLARPDHRLRSIGLLGAADPEREPLDLAITGVTQDEPVDGRADGSTTPDARRGTRPDRLLLRAERSRRGDGRVYRVAFVAVDSAGGSCTGVVTVGVPRSRRAVVVDSGARHDALSARGGRARGRG